MILYLIYIVRIFSEKINFLGPLIVSVILLLSLFVPLKMSRQKKNFGGKNENLKTGSFLSFLIIYTLVHLVGILIAYYKLGSSILYNSMIITLQPLSVVALYYIVSSELVLELSHIKKLLNFVIMIYVFIALFGFFEVITHRVERAMWPCYHPNSLGFVLAILSSYKIISPNPNQIKKLIIALCLTCGLFATKSLSSIIIWLIILFLYALANRKFKYIFYMVFLLSIFYLFVGRYLVSTRLAELQGNWDYYVYLWNMGGGRIRLHGFINSFEWRILNWGTLYHLFLKSPWIGYGTSSWLIVNPIRDNPGSLGGYHPHAETFSWLIQFGVIGSLVIGFIFIKSIGYNFRRAQLANSFQPFGVIFPGLLITAVLGKSLFNILCFFILILIYFSCRYDEVNASKKKNMTEG